MSLLRFLADEDFNHDLLAHLRSIEPTLDIVAVGEPEAPPKGTKDRELLVAAATMQRTLVSGDRSTLPRHLGDFFRGGHHMAGLILLRGGFSLSRLASEIRLIWFATEAEEWIDRTDYIPY